MSSTSCDDAPFRFELAVSAWTPDTSEEGIASLADAGATAMEPGPSFLLDQGPDEVAAAAQRYRSAGIRIYSCHAPFEGPAELAQADPAGRARAIDMHARAIRAAAAAGASVLVAHSSLPCPAQGPETAARRDGLRAALEALIGHTERAGVALALENLLPGRIGSEGEDLRAIVDGFDSPHLGVCLDTGHAHVTNGGLPAVFQAVRGRIINFHLHDNDRHADKHLQPPYGSIDWEPFIAQLRQLRPAHPLTVEAPPWDNAGHAVQLREVRALFAGGRAAVTDGGRHFHLTCPRCRRYVFVAGDETFCGCSRAPAGN